MKFLLKTEDIAHLNFGQSYRYAYNIFHLYFDSRENGKFLITKYVFSSSSCDLVIK